MAGGKPDRIAVAIEVPRGPVVEALLEGGLVVFSINPKQLDRFRDRYTVAGAKDDSRDAYVLGDSLRTDQHCFRRVAIDHPDVLRLRELSRTEESISEDFRRVVNQLYQLLLRYYPQLLQLNSTPDEPWIWTLLEKAPIPQRGAQLTIARLKTLLWKYRIRRWTAEQVRDAIASPPLDRSDLMPSKYPCLLIGWAPFQVSVQALAGFLPAAWRNAMVAKRAPDRWAAEARLPER